MHKLEKFADHIVGQPLHGDVPHPVAHQTEDGHQKVRQRQVEGQQRVRRLPVRRPVEQHLTHARIQNNPQSGHREQQNNVVDSVEKVAGIGLVDEEQNNRRIITAGFVILHTNTHIRTVDRVVNHKIRHHGQNNDENLIRSAFFCKLANNFVQKTVTMTIIIVTMKNNGGKIGEKIEEK